MEGLPGHVASVAPGMTQVITAGEKYTLVDDNGAELELEGRDRPWVIEFIVAFDNYMDSAAKLGEDNDHVGVFRRKLQELWLGMPQDLRDKLPSTVTSGIKIDVHAH